MSHNKSSKKDAPQENNCDISDKTSKYVLFPSLAKAYKLPGEGKRAFMQRIGMGKQGSMFADFLSGNRNLTDLSFDKIRMSLRWTAEETEKWEQLLEKDHETLRKSIKSKPKKSNKQQPVTDIEESSIEFDATNKTAAFVEPKTDVRVLAYEEMRPHANILNPVGRLLFFGHIVNNMNLRKFAVKANISEEWLSNLIFNQKTDYEWIELMMAELEEKLEMSDALRIWILTGKCKTRFEFLVSEYRGNIADTSTGEKNALKEAGNSSC